MAHLLHIRYTPHDFSVTDSGPLAAARMRRDQGHDEPIRLDNLPVLMWESGALWDEVNLYFTCRADDVLDGDVRMATVHFDAQSLAHFATFLESQNLNWFAFGEERAKRPTNVYRGHLIRLRERSQLAPSTASARMAAVLRFYRWVQSRGLLNPEFPAFKQRTHKIRYRDKIGFQQTLTVYSTNLHIPNKKRGRGVRLEGGLHAVSPEVRDKIMLAAREHCSIEFQFMLALGFSTGMRLQTILDLKIETLDKSIPGQTPEGQYLRIGPNAHPAVATKFGIDGKAFIPRVLLEQLREYVTSIRRSNRQAIAQPEDRGLVFLNRFGQRYCRRGADMSPSVNKDMERLRSAVGSTLDLREFYFHCTRATFATGVASAGLSIPGMSPLAVIRRVKDLLLQKNEATAQRYIDYVQENRVQATFEKQYASWLFGKDNNA